MKAASTKIPEDAVVMQHRTSRAVSRTRDASEAIVGAMTRSQAAVLSRARSRYRMTANKLLTEHSEEADANARLLDAVASMRDVRQLPALLVRDVDGLAAACFHAAWR